MLLFTLYTRVLLQDLGIFIFYILIKVLEKIINKIYN